MDQGNKVFKPVAVLSESHGSDHVNVGQEITGQNIKKTELLRLLNEFSGRSHIKELARTHGLADDYLFRQARQFRIWRGFFL